LRKRNLTKQKICQQALILIAAEGLEGLSMRKLADQLNVEAASLYNHIANKAELFDMLQEHLYSQLQPPKANVCWQEHLMGLARATRKGLLKYPRVIPLFATRPTITVSSLIQLEMTLNILLQAGFKHSEVITIYQNLHVYILGHALAEIGKVPGQLIEEVNDPSLNKINLNTYPTLKKAYSFKSSTDFAKGFEKGIRNIIRGLETQLNQKRG
jgi:AcrR family transcriptional regulator